MHPNPSFPTRPACKQAKTLWQHSGWLALVLSLAPNAHAGSVAPTLWHKAKNQSEVKVIVRLNQAYQAEAGLHALARAAQQTTTANLQNKVLDRLNQLGLNFNSANLRRYQTLPYLALSVDAPTLSALQADPNVAEVVEDKLSQPTLDVSVPLIGGPQAWAAGFNGAGQTVAVLDTGVLTSHSFLHGNAVAEACFSTTFAPQNSTSACPGGVHNSTAAGSGQPCDLAAIGCDHGTHVSGIATGSNQSMKGVAPAAQLMAVQVFSVFDASLCGGVSSCAMSFDSDQLAGLEYVYQQRNQFAIASVNMSLGGDLVAGTCDNAIIKPAIDNLRAAGIATAIAAGNSSSTTQVSTPGCISSAITVSSSNDSNLVSSFSNVGEMTDLFAPGSNINSSSAFGLDQFVIKDGTSMATPHVAGAWAVMKSAWPEASVDAIEALLKNTGLAIVDTNYTRPRLDLNAAINTLNCVDTADSDSDGLPNCREGLVGRNPAVKDNDIFGDNSSSRRLFALQQFRDLLYRESLAKPVQYWVTQMNNGMNRTQVVLAFMNSNPANTQIKPVARLMLAYFGHLYLNNSFNGLTYWEKQLTSGSQSADQISVALSNSNAFNTMNGVLTDTQFVNLVYQNLLARQPDDTERNAALNQISSQSRGLWVRSFAETAPVISATANQVFVELIFAGMGKKVPTNTGEQFWLNKLAADSLAGQTEMVNAYLGVLLPNYSGAASAYRARFLP